MSTQTRTIEHIINCAGIPSFSSFEERIHPYIFGQADKIEGVTVKTIPENNLLVKIPGRSKGAPVALTAHLDKINHYGENHPEKLPVEENDGYLEGLLDDSTGLGILLSIMEKSEENNFPTIYLLLSEMEESYGLRKHPELLRNNGKNLFHSMGAENLSRYLIEQKIKPAVIITVDTTPLFKGQNGVALYSRPWEMNEEEPSLALEQATNDIVKQLTSIEPELRLSNNTNDYLSYGRFFNNDPYDPVPSVAIEPAIYPYHQKNEKVALQDIQTTERILVTFLEKYGN
ncbi:MAG TPA: M20/M25/M40 family metallo-hydrolase [Balneolales bacterium]|nr:M20/M25/M40 family metallo-hydrolase [Balneolales bacterium]